MTRRFRDCCEVASHCFLHSDLVGRHYMAFMLQRSARLQLLRLNDDAPNDYERRVHRKGVVASLGARDAVSLEHLHLMAVLELGGTLLLYSGTVLMGRVHVGGVLSSRQVGPATAAMTATAMTLSARGSLGGTCYKANVVS